MPLAPRLFDLVVFFCCLGRSPLHVLWLVGKEHDVVYHITVRQRRCFILPLASLLHLALAQIPHFRQINGMQPESTLSVDRYIKIL